MGIDDQRDAANIRRTMLLHQSHKNDAGTSQHLVYAHINVTQTRHAEQSRERIEQTGNGEKKVHPCRYCQVGRGRHCRRLCDQRLSFGCCSVVVAVILFHIFVVILGPRVSGKWKMKIECCPVHDQSKAHADKHACRRNAQHERSMIRNWKMASVEGYINSKTATTHTRGPTSEQSYRSSLLLCSARTHAPKV